MKNRIFATAALLAAFFVAGCTGGSDFPAPDEPPFGGQPGWDGPGTEGPGDEAGEAPDFDYTIRDYDGERADDAADDTVGSDKDFYWEANNFKTKVTVDYAGTTASVACDNSAVLWHTEGAHVVIDLQTNDVSGTEIVLAGKSDDGSLKIYGGSKYKLTLNGVELTSTRGPAINSQCKKRVYIHLADGTTNRLTDAAVYAEDVWYIDAAKAASEDRKGALFSEGHQLYSGTGVLVVAGRQKHGIASDGYLFTRPGVTIAVTEAAKNAIHIKGDADDGIGIRIAGGLIYAQVASDAGKGMKTDLDVEILGGRLDLNTSGPAIYEAEENDTSSAAGIKSDGSIRIAGGTVTIKSTGMGGKGINSDGGFTMSGGEVTIATTGGKYVYNAALDLESSPKGVKAEGDIVIDDGVLNISVTGQSDGSEGLESKSTLTINGGELYIYAYDDAINASQAITINGGRTFAYAVNNDGIDSNGTLTITGGVVIASGSNAPEEAFDCDRSSDFRITGGTLIGTSGAAISPSTASTQRTVIYNGLQLSKGDDLAILDSTGKPIATYQIPRSFQQGLCLFFSSADLAANATYTLSKGGTLSGASERWNGWTADGSWSGGTQVGTFTCNNMVTVVGQSNGPGGGGGGMPSGGGGPGHP